MTPKTTMDRVKKDLKILKVENEKMIAMDRGTWYSVVAMGF